MTRGFLWVSGILALVAGLLLGESAVAGGETPPLKLLLVVGAPGQEEYASNFVSQAEVWKAAAERVGACIETVGLKPALEESAGDRDQLRQTLDQETKDGSLPLWLVMIGHGTFDGRNAKLNLRGPDLSASDLAAWLRPFHRPLVLINTASASAPFLNALSGTNRVVITATRSGNEINYARFGGYFANAIASTAADLDKDGQVSLLEAFLTASRQTADFYKLEGRIATERSLIDDNGDGKGTPADWFQGLRPVKKPDEKTAADGLFARQLCLVPSAADDLLTPGQRERRDELERAVLLHREKKAALPEEEYYRELEAMLLEMARLMVGSEPAGAPGK